MKNIFQIILSFSCLLEIVCFPPSHLQISRLFLSSWVLHTMYYLVQMNIQIIVRGAIWFPGSELYYHTLFFLPELVILIWNLDLNSSNNMLDTFNTVGRDSSLLGL